MMHGRCLWSPAVSLMLMLLLLLLLSISPSRALECPEECRCASGAGAGTVVCQDWPVARPVELGSRPVTHLVMRNVSGAVPDAFFAGVSGVRWLEVRGGTRLQLGRHSLDGLHQLRRLTITDTDLTHLPPHALALLPRLLALDVSRNRLSRLYQRQFTYNTHLQQLNVSGNPLAGGVHARAFAGADRLRQLNVSHCGIRRAAAAWFRDTPALETLDLSGNGISRLLVGDARWWRALRWLDLSGNELSHLEAGVFNASINLTRVDLSHNYIDRLLDTGLRASVLVLDNNSFTVANRSYLQLPEQLQQLQLSACSRLTHVGRNLLQLSTRLERVTIGHNERLTSIAPSAFSRLDRLRRVDIGDNALRKLPRSLSALSLDSLRVSGNPLVCDCSLQWYRDRAGGPGPLTCLLDDARLPLADGLAHVLCRPVSVTAHQTQAWVPINGSVELRCRRSGRPSPALTWVTPQRYVFHWRPSGSEPHHPARHTAALTDHRQLDHFAVLDDGRLRVSAAAARHQGRYVCLAENDASAKAASVYLTVGVSSLHDIKMMALLMALTGCLTAITFALIVRLGLYIFYKCGCCICCTDELPPVDKRVKSLADTVDQWRAQQLDSLRDNYNQQVAGIKDSCYQQVERIRDSYKGQVRYLGDMRDYGAQQIEGFREQYLDQVRRVRDYSLGQMNRVHENYIFQRNRIRKFSSHQRVRLRETCKYQQRTLNKILENLPDLYLQNCRTGTCQRTDSMMLPGDHFYCDAEAQWSVDQLNAFYYPPGDDIDEPDEPTEAQLDAGLAGVEALRHLPSSDKLFAAESSRPLTVPTLGPLSLLCPWEEPLRSRADLGGARQDWLRTGQPSPSSEVEAAASSTQVSVVVLEVEVEPRVDSSSVSSGSLADQPDRGQQAESSCGISDGLVDQPDRGQQAESSCGISDGLVDQPDRGQQAESSCGIPDGLADQPDREQQTESSC